jgi:DNA-binding NarL/FixJ family response regulator
MRAGAPPLLTERQQAVLGLLVQGEPHDEIAQQLGIPRRTVKAYVRQLASRLGLRSGRGLSRRVALSQLKTGDGRLPLPKMKPRLTTVTSLAFEGWTSREIAERIGITEGTVRQYLHEIYAETNVWNRLELLTRYKPN